MRWTALLLMPLFCASVLAQDRPAEPPDDAYVDSLVRQLGSRSRPRRLRAQKRLEALGRRALPRLAAANDSPDQEVRIRTRELLGKLGWAPAPVQREIDRQLAIIRRGTVWVSIPHTPRSLPKRHAALTRLLRMGPAARVQLRRALHPTGGKPVVRLAVDRPVVAPGEPVACLGVMRNTGSGGAWLPRWLPRIYVSHEPFEPRITFVVPGRYGGGGG